MSPGPENVKVCVRCRPMNEKEEQQKFKVIVKVDEESSSISLRNPHGKDDDPSKTFVFDYVFGVGSKQLDIYNRIARPIVEQVFEGYNGKLDKHLSSTFKIYRNHFCIWTNRNRQDLYHGWRPNHTRTPRNNTKFICPCIWSYCKGWPKDKVPCTCLLFRDL